MSLIVKKVKRKRRIKPKAILVYSTRIVIDNTNSGTIITTLKSNKQ